MDLALTPSSRTSEDEDDSDEENNSVSPFQEESSKGDGRSDSDQEPDNTPWIEYGQENTDRLWPGKHNPKLLSRFVNLHFGGDWHAYIHFSRWAENKRLTTTNAISLDEWLSLRADGTEYELTTSMLGVKRSDGGQYHEQTTLAKLSTKTAHSSIVSSPSAADSDNAIPGIRSPVQKDIRDMFPARRIPTSEETTAYKIADAIIEQQEIDDAQRVTRMKARAEKFAAAAQLKVATEKGVTWTVHPSAGTTDKPADNPMMDEDTLVTRAPSTRRANINDLTSQLNKQELIAASATAQAIYLQSTPVKVEQNFRRSSRPKKRQEESTLYLTL